MINYGESKIDKIMFGEQMIDKVMYGESLLFSSGPEPVAYFKFIGLETPEVSVTYKLFGKNYYAYIGYTPGKGIVNNVPIYTTDNLQFPILNDKNFPISNGLASSRIAQMNEDDNIEIQESAFLNFLNSLIDRGATYINVSDLHLTKSQVDSYKTLNWRACKIDWPKPDYWFAGTTIEPNQTFTFKVNSSNTYTIASDDNCKFSYKPDFNTSNVTSMYEMFRNCINLQSLDLSNFDTSNVTDMSYMFTFCINLQSLDLSNFDTSNVTDMSGMFNYCSKLQSLDLSNFDTSNVTTYMFDMFYDCNNLNYIRCKSSFRHWCWENQDAIKLPAAMREGGSGTWDIIV